METPLHDLLQKAAENQKKGREFVMATVVVGAQKTPGRSGFKLIWYPDGTFEGTVGGGKLERLVLDKCAALLETGQNDFAEYDLTEEPAGIGVQCGGIAKVFFEYFPPLRKAYIFGAGHLCRSLLPILDSFGFHLVVIDNRPEFASRELLPEADEVHAIDYFAFLDDFHPVRNDAVIIFTHGHLYDFDILDMLCRKNIQVRYIGMIGSRDKVKNAVSRIKTASYAGNLIERIYAPIGLNIGKTTTQEIAVAIAAEILAVYNDVREVDFLSRMSANK